jgi:hypothetical protein
MRRLSVQLSNYLERRTTPDPSDQNLKAGFGSDVDVGRGDPRSYFKGLGTQTQWIFGTVSSLEARMALTFQKVDAYIRRL